LKRLWQVHFLAGEQGPLPTHADLVEDRLLWVHIFSGCEDPEGRVLTAQTVTFKSPEK
jgi:hypothetical protein